MSGVCAVVSRTGQPVGLHDVDPMVAAAPHRAAAGERRHHEPLVCLAQLSRSLTPDGVPLAPALDSASGVVVLADARIDNGDEIRCALGLDAPRGTGAPALVLAAYLRWGVGALPRFIGDFALAIWDPRDRTMLLARDPLAMRALYYRIESRRVLIATEVKQILAVPGVPDEPDERMAAAFLAGSFGSPEWSYYRGIAQVAPGHAVQLQGTSVRSWRFWDIDPEHQIRYPDARDYAEHLRELFVDAVRSRLSSQQPAGILLSGGIDSGAAASAAGWLIERERSAPRLRSYSWDFGPLTMCDERETSRHIVERYDIAAKDIPVDDAGPLAGYPDHAPDVDDPFHGHFQTMLDRGFAAASSDGVGPLFTGMRGDLAIGPIDEDYESLLRSGRVLALLGEVRRRGDAPDQRLRAVLRHEVGPVAMKVARQSRPAVWLRWAVRRQGRPSRPAPRETAAFSRWIDPSFARRVGLEELISTYAESPAPPVAGPLRRRRYEWIFMPMHLRWSVSHERRVAGFGMEAVDPWSDRRVVEFCLAVPQQIFDRPGAARKQLVREAMADIMPARFLAAAGKTLPGPLFRGTLRGPAAPIIEELLRTSRAGAAGWIDPATLRDDFERFRRGEAEPGPLWWGLSLEWWLRQRERL